MPLHLWASTRSPAVLASQGRAMPARSVWAVAPSRAARSSTYVGSSAPVMSARALMRGSYRKHQRSGEAVPPIPMDRK
eukprot:4072617-Pyramimonas_sp.AAC.1